jgi:hypothetical protein
VACQATEPSDHLIRVYRVEVLPHLGECNNAWFTVPCLQLRAAGQDQAHGHLGSIEGFSFTWGNHSALLIAEYLIPNPPADGSSRRFELRDVIATEPVLAGSEFAFNAWPESRSILRKDATHLNMFLGLDVACGDDCAAIGAAIDAQHRFEMTLRHTGNPDAPVQIVAWRSCVATIRPTQCDNP